MPEGAYRELTSREVSALHKLTSTAQTKAAQKSPAARRRAAEEARKTRVKLERKPAKKQGTSSGSRQKKAKRGEGRRR